MVEDDVGGSWVEVDAEVDLIEAGAGGGSVEVDAKGGWDEVEAGGGLVELENGGDPDVFLRLESSASAGVGSRSSSSSESRSSGPNRLLVTVGVGDVVDRGRLYPRLELCIWPLNQTGIPPVMSSPVVIISCSPNSLSLNCLRSSPIHSSISAAEIFLPKFRRRWARATSAACSASRLSMLSSVAVISSFFLFRWC